MDRDLDPTEDIDVDAIEDEIITCARCGAGLARRADVIPGDQHPVYANPAGLVFELVLVSAAPGTRSVTGPVREHTWFAGYAWRVGICAACRAHVGWHYEAADGRSPSRFVGLIADRIR